jgi:N-acetyl-beta-hexosaminidase
MPLQDNIEIENILDEATDSFEDKLKQLFDELDDSSKINVSTNHMDWCAQVSAAGDELRKELNHAIERMEKKFLNGEFK